MKILRATDLPKQVLVKVYGTGNKLAEDQEFEVSESDAVALVKAGRATYEIVVKEEKAVKQTKEEKTPKKTK